MSDFIILTDSTSDLNAQLREKYAIDYFKMQFSSSERTYDASLDWEDISPSDFYNAMRNGTSFTTVQVSLQSYTNKFRQYLSQGMDILYIGCSSALSGSVTSSYIIRDQLKTEFPNNRIYCFDSLISGMGQGMMAIRAAQMKAEGKTVEEVYNWLCENVMKHNQMGSTECLEYLKKSGRIKASSAFFGDLFAVKPLIISDTNGQNLAIRKVKGRKNALSAMVNHIAQYIEAPESQTIYIGHADSEADAMLVRDLVLERFPGTKVETNIIGPIVGASVGPGTIIAYYYGKEKSTQMKDV
ncbi:MAG: DegV family protein [Clostridia bacterium]|nr:DegV family protein [Clostridia bacterium]